MRTLSNLSPSLPWRAGVLLALALLLTFAWPETAPARPAAGSVALSHRMEGGPFRYTVVKGDTLSEIGGRFGERLARLLQVNRIPNPARIYPGQTVLVDNRHIVPPSFRGAILVNIPQKMLFLYSGKRLLMMAPVALGMPTDQTPVGSFRVINKSVDPEWFVPSSIQEEMRQRGKTVVTKVPPGPGNPLGKYWIGLNIPDLGIHGTNAPSSIFHFTTHGCIRLFPDTVKTLYAKIRIGDPVEVLYEPILVYRTKGGRVFLEVHRDVYHKVQDFDKIFARWVLRHPKIRLDRKKARQALGRQEGRPVEVSLIPNY